MRMACACKTLIEINGRFVSEGGARLGLKLEFGPLLSFSNVMLLTPMGLCQK